MEIQRQRKNSFALKEPTVSLGYLALKAFYEIEAGCSQEEGPKKGFVRGSRTRGVQEILEKCM